MGDWARQINGLEICGYCIFKVGELDEKILQYYWGSF
jgi:hypothetical protein